MLRRKYKLGQHSIIYIYTNQQYVSREIKSLPSELLFSQGLHVCSAPIKYKYIVVVWVYVCVWVSVKLLPLFVFICVFLLLPSFHLFFVLLLLGLMLLYIRVSLK